VKRRRNCYVVVKTAQKPYRAGTGHADGSNLNLSPPGRQVDGLGALRRNPLDGVSDRRHHGPGAMKAPQFRRGDAMTDPERDHLLHRVEELDRNRRRWKVLALAGTPLLLLLFLLALGNAVSSSLALREMAQREQVARDRAMQAEQEALMQAEVALENAEEARRAVKAAQKRAEQAVQNLP
jgi:hypothetical protein